VRILLERLEAVKVADQLSRVAVVRGFIKWRIQPIKERDHPAYEYSGRKHPTRESPSLWVPKALDARVSSLFQKDVAVRGIPLLEGIRLERPPNRAKCLRRARPFCFPTKFTLVACFVQETCPIFVSHPPLPEEAPLAVAAVGPSVQPLVADEEEVAEDPTIPPLIRKRKGKEVAETVAKKAKVSTLLRMGGALKIGGEGENPPPVAEGGGARSAAPASRPATETGLTTLASPHLEPIERSAQRATERSTPSPWVPEPTMKKSNPAAGALSSGRKRGVVLKRCR